MFLKFLSTYSRVLIFVTKIVSYCFIKDIMPKEITSNKSKVKRSFGARAVKELPGAVTWGAWFRPTPSPSQSPSCGFS